MNKKVAPGDQQDESQKPLLLKEEHIITTKETKKKEVSQEKNEKQSIDLLYLKDFFNHSKWQFLFLFTNALFFVLFRNNIYNENNFPEGMEACFSLRVWSSLLEFSYFVGIFIRIWYLTLMGIVIYYKKIFHKGAESENKSNKVEGDKDYWKKMQDKRVTWNLRYKWWVEKRDIFLGLIIIAGIFLLVGMTIATSQNEPCGNLRGLALFWIYIYNLVFFFFPVALLLMCLYPYNIACKIFSGFLKFYSLQEDIFLPPKTDDLKQN